MSSNNPIVLSTPWVEYPLGSQNRMFKRLVLRASAPPTALIDTNWKEEFISEAEYVSLKLKGEA